MGSTVTSGTALRHGVRGDRRRPVRGPGAPAVRRPAAPAGSTPAPGHAVAGSARLRSLVPAGLVAVDLCTLSLPLAWLGGATVRSTGYVLVAILLLAVAGAYRPRITLTALEQAPHHVLRLGFAFLLATPLALLGAWGPTPALHALSSVPAFVVGRSAAYAALRWARRRRLIAEPTLVIGGGALAMDLLTTLEEHPEYGLRAVGFVDDGPQLDDRAAVGDLAGVDAALDRHGVRTVIVAFGPTREADLVGLVRSAALRDIEVFVVPRFFDVGITPTGPDVEDVWGIPLHRVRRAASHRHGWRVKRLADVVVAGTALTLLSPLLAAVALAVRVSSPGPVLFRQLRTGQQGKPIGILKFRTLRVAAPEPAATGQAGTPGSTRHTMYARRVDVERRQTAVGTFLRRTSLDELPQLWNILRGDMSLVGPRPEECGYAAQFADSVHGYRDRHRLAVGLTGWAQVNGLRGDTSIEQRARFDNHYIEQWSLWRDSVILLRTFAAVCRQATGAVRSAGS